MSTALQICLYNGSTAKCQMLAAQAVGKRKPMNTEFNPYDPPGHVDVVGSQGNLQCPYCEQFFALTWKRYARAPLGVHLCPHCGKKSKLGNVASYHLKSTASTLVLMGLGGIVGAAAVFWIGWVSLTLVALSVLWAILVFDRALDARRPLEKIDP